MSDSKNNCEGIVHKYHKPIVIKIITQIFFIIYLKKILL